MISETCQFSSSPDGVKEHGCTRFAKVACVECETPLCHEHCGACPKCQKPTCNACLAFHKCATDVVVANEGSVFTFTPLTPAAKSWFAENVQSDGWQWLGNSLVVDHRFACGLVDGIREAGLEVR